MTNLPSLSAREYKLLLDRKQFPSTTVDDANVWLRKKLVPRLGVPCNGAFKKTDKRNVRFFDTGGSVLNARGYVLRERIEAGDPSEITLKLRTPDFFVSGSTAMGVTGEPKQQKLEEDIAPIAVRSRTVRFAKPPAVYSRYSQSTKIERTGAHATLGDLFADFVDLEADLAGASFRPKDKLLKGPVVDEIVHKGPAIALGPEVEAELSLTFWRFRKSGKEIAEVSYKYEIGESLDPSVGRLALEVFVRLCARLPLESRLLSKTALALPQK